MKDFRLFDIADFVMDEDFIRWVKEKRKEDNDFWDNWLNKHPEKYMTIAEARRILESIETEEPVVDKSVIENEVDRLLFTINEQADQPVSGSRTIRMASKWWYAAAGLILAVSSLIVYLLISGSKGTEEFAYTKQTSSRGLKESINSSEDPVTLRLPDGSTVELAPNSRVSYAENFNSNGTRDVYLAGEGFFTVTKNPSRPFRVFANEIVSKVVGTSFSVRSFEKDTIIQVTVRTGKVSVYSQAIRNRATGTQEKPGEIMVTPNQQILYKKDDRSFQKILLKNPVMISAETKTRNKGYEDAPLETVFRELSSAYEINIVYDKDLLKNCTITANLPLESFYQKLDLICKAIGASYEIIDGQIVIQSNGCSAY